MDDLRVTSSVTSCVTRSQFLTATVTGGEIFVRREKKWTVLMGDTGTVNGVNEGNLQHSYTVELECGGGSTDKKKNRDGKAEEVKDRKTEFRNHNSFWLIFSSDDNGRRGNPFLLIINGRCPSSRRFQSRRIRVHNPPHYRPVINFLFLLPFLVVVTALAGLVDVVAAVREGRFHCSHFS